MRALLLVDLQKDFCHGGALEVKDGNKIIPVANKLIDKFNHSKDLIVATKDWHPVTHKSFAINSNGKIGELGELNGLPQVWWPVHCVQNEKGSEFHSDLKPVPYVFYKGTDIEVDSYSGFYDNGKKHSTGLTNFFKEKNIDTLYILGLATDYCVKYTALDALEDGFKVFLVKDGCRGVNISPDDSEKTLKELEKKGVKIITSDFVK